MDASPLGKLAPELRNIIYKMVLKDRSEIRIGASDGGCGVCACSHEILQVSLLRVCKQLNAECEPVFYGINTFTIDLFVWMEHWDRQRYETHLLHRFTSLIGHRASVNLRNIRLITFARDAQQYPEWAVEVMAHHLQSLQATAVQNPKSNLRYRFEFVVDGAPRMVGGMSMSGDHYPTFGIRIRSIDEDLARASAFIESRNFIPATLKSDFITALEEMRKDFAEKASEEQQRVVEI
jgi:hypothetical protein